jgi:hypothetical protein
MPGRRHFLQFTLAFGEGLTSSALAPRVFSAEAARALPAIDGAVTLYTEFRVTPPQHALALAAVDALAQTLRSKPGFIGLALKQMSGESTMVKNYPERYKGVLANAYLDGVAAHTQPYYYSLFIRFDDAASLHAAHAAQSFDERVLPHLHPIMPGATGPRSGAEPMAIYRGVFQTIAAGDRHGIYTSPAAIRAFLNRPMDDPGRETVTVGNHVMIADQGHHAWERHVGALLKVAQETYQPMGAAREGGLPGAADNRHYRKALTTEILRNAHADGELRAYLMHGVWESVWDHENSHLDPRFLGAAGPVGAAIKIGPVEPFYLTRRLIVGHADRV